MKITLLIALLTVPLFTMNCDAEVILTEHDGGQKIVLQQGDQFSIRLPAHPSTGYTWSLLMTPKSDGIVIQKQLQEFQFAPKGAILCGGGGVEIWKFMAAKPGKTKLTFSYSRPWERDVPSVQVIEYDLVVKLS